GVRLTAQTAPAKVPSTPPPPAFKPTPEQLAIEAASEKEHQREMGLLGIKKLRPGVDGNANSANPANYDESKADVYPNLPDPLLLANGKRVNTAKMWWNERRPEIAGLFGEDILGKIPVHLPKVTWEVVSTRQEKNGDVPVITKTLVGRVDNSADPNIKVNIDLTLTTPADAKGPVPVMMELGFSREFMAMLMKRFPQFAALAGPGPTWQQQVLARGWGYAEYVPTSVQPDNGAGLTEGIIGLANKGHARSLEDWGALRAWGWGASRALDYLETDKAVDAKQVGIEGHSRYGKASLVAMAYDPRFAIGYISSSGEAGAKLYRHIFGEEIGNVAATNEFHWMAGNFMKYAATLNAGDLPVDNHELVALCAPRPVFISGGATEGDGWVDAKGMFLAAVGAGPVYRLLGKKDLGATAFPPEGTALITGDLGFRQHFGGHTPAPNWPTFLDFASRYLHAPGQALAAGPVPMHLTADDDRSRMLQLLGIKESQMRPRPAGDANAPNATNYDEAKANVYPNLPDPLLLKNGERVTSAETWWKQRRPQIVDDFNREILGEAPAHLPKVTWSVASTAPGSSSGIDVVTKRLVGHVDNSAYPQVPVNIEMTLITPAHAAGPVPVIMELAFAKDFEKYAAGPLPEAPAEYGVPWQPVLKKGWGFAVLSPTSFQADDGSGLTEGIIGLMNKGQPRSLSDWGTLRAWAWGASRALDYLETDKSVDAKRVGLEGHSRFGKTVLVAMAYDPRFAIVYSSSSGEGGAKLYRHIFGEQMPNITGPSLYHWFDGNFLRYGGPLTPADLPVDNHELIALCAPRPVFIGGGSTAGDGYANPKGDAWADPRGMFLAEVAAAPVYKLLGKTGLGTTKFPPMETAQIGGDLGFRQHADGHTPVPNWPAFLEFASRYLEVPGDRGQTP
ncbi:MAG TPA: hypothetical protein VFE01_00885, partial [Terracidiphilus sp.]|nr:hypothetical protein [Terracidiphilus sp.]